MLGNMGGNNVQSEVRKSKKKQGKDEKDKIKQAEKKRRRLEKALANSAAIRIELEKKKEKKKEEQQRLDEEGAAIAEAVALHVLLGEEEDGEEDVISNDEGGWLNKWDNNKNWFDGGGGMGIIGRGVSDPYHEWWNVGTDAGPRYLDDVDLDVDAGFIATQAISSLRIR